MRELNSGKAEPRERGVHANADKMPSLRRSEARSNCPTQAKRSLKWGTQGQAGVEMCAGTLLPEL
jgi:hypothetical protein